MTEKQLREQVVEIATMFLGCNEADGSYKQIIDIYNSHKPLARGYKVKYTDAWCATFVSAVAIRAGVTNIIPTECGCEKQINLFKTLGAWQENDAYTPSVGDVIYYDWQDSGAGDNRGNSDHVGIVVSVSGNTIKVIEGNISNKVGYRNIKVNAKGIRGYGVPKYSSLISKNANFDIENLKKGYKIGDLVIFDGCLHYTSSSASGVAKACKAGLAKITAISPDKAHPYHLQAVAGKGSTVYGWVNAKDIAGKSSGKWYRVVSGDTLSKIAVKHNTTVEVLMALNGIKNKNLIRTGQIIYLP